VTIVSGIIYMKALTVIAERSGGASTPTEQELKAATEAVMSDKNSVKDMLKAAKASYKPQTS
jgi:hypothetical protein